MQSLQTTALVLMLIATASAAAEPQHLLVEISVNHQPRGARLLRWNGDGEIFVTARDLRDWGVLPPYPEPERHGGTLLYSLTDFEDVQTRYSPGQAALDIEFPASMLPTTHASLRSSAPNVVAGGAGGYFDYDISYTQAREGYAAAWLAPTVFSRYGALQADIVCRSAAGFETTSWDDGCIRLDTTWSIDDVERMRSFRAGDVISLPGVWGGAYRLGGLQLASNFSTRPTYITFPVPAISGEARLPSNVELYVNGALRYQEQVAPGAFRVEDIPVTTGEGQVRMVVTDVLGREQIYAQDFYASSELLHAGLQEYSYTIGALRRNYGITSGDYDEAAFVGAHRFGVSDALTIGGRLEASADTQLISGSADWAGLGPGIWSTGLSGSTGKLGHGAAATLGYQFQGEEFRFGAQVLGSHPQFALLDSEQPGSLPELQFILNGGWSRGIGGSVGATLVHQKFAGSRRDIFSLSHNRVINREYVVSIYGSYIREEEADFTIGLTVTKSFGERSSVSSYAARELGVTRMRAEMHQSVPAGTGVGYRIGATASDRKQVDANATLQNRVGRLFLEAQHADETSSWRTTATGSITWLGGRAYLAREVGDGFAVAKVGSFENVRVYVENQEIGRTDANGTLLLSGLRPYQSNRISIAAADLPVDASVDSFQMTVAPAYRSGAIADFEVRESRSLLLRVLDETGEPVPEGATVSRPDSLERMLVGAGGIVFLNEVEEPMTVQIGWMGRDCRIDVPLPQGRGLTMSIEDITCIGISQ